MSRLRLAILTVGPLLLVAVSFAASSTGLHGRSASSVGRKSQLRLSPPPRAAADNDSLADACKVTAEGLRTRLAESCQVIVRAPYVLAGDISEKQLDWLYRDTLLPTAAALRRCYFDRKPDRPILVVLLSGDEPFLDAAGRLDDCQPSRYAGYYERSERRIVLNLATGYGTLAHELSHALAQFDFPEMPEWFDEGLAALHEEARFSADALQLVGLPNWRTHLLSQAARGGDLPSMELLITSQSFRGEGEGLNYACVRCFCHYLQERGLLSHFYRKFRTTVAHDPTGIHTLCEVLGVPSSAEIDHDFRKWIRTQNAPKPSEQSVDGRQ